MSEEIVTMKEVIKLLEGVNKKRDIVNSYRPLNKIALLKIKETFHVKDICNSLRIEGINFTERETRVLLEHAKLKEKDCQDVTGVLNLNSAIRMMERHVDKKTELSIDLINELHYLCMSNILKHTECGNIRNDGVVITQSQHIPPHHSKVKKLLEEVIAEYRSSNEDRLLAIFRFKHRLTNIHPYFDGNGRVSRLVLNMLLLTNRYVPIIIDADSKLDYYESLEYADLYHDYRKFFKFMLKQLDNTYDMYLHVYNALGDN